MNSFQPPRASYIQWSSPQRGAAAGGPFPNDLPPNDLPPNDQQDPPMAELAPLAPKQPEGFTPSDYSVAVEPSRKRVTVVFNGEVVADSRRALVLKEDRKSTRLNSSH